MDKEKRMSVIQFLLEGATEILGEETLKERFTEMGNSKIDTKRKPAARIPGVPQRCTTN